MAHTQESLEALKAADLRPIAKQFGITGASKRKKADNIVLILKAQGEQFVEDNTAEIVIETPVPPQSPSVQAEDRIHRVAQVSSDLPVDVDTANQVAQQGPSAVAAYLLALIAKHGRKREARRFRKSLRQAGHFGLAGIDLREYHANGQLKKAA
jgi:hypothetical protein